MSLGHKSDPLPSSQWWIIYEITRVFYNETVNLMTVKWNMFSYIKRESWSELVSALVVNSAEIPMTHNDQEERPAFPSCSLSLLEKHPGWQLRDMWLLTHLWIVVGRELSKQNSCKEFFSIMCFPSDYLSKYYVFIFKNIEKIKNNMKINHKFASKIVYTQSSP